MYQSAIATSYILAIQRARFVCISDGSVVSFQKTAVAVLASVVVFLKTAVAVLMRLW